MKKKGYNWKSRQVVKTVVDNSSTKQIQLDIPIKGNYDASNELVLPSSKRKTKIKQDQTKITRILSKKHRKRLEKIVEKKKKKENRANLLEALSKVQATPEELSKLTSITSIQTKGLKRHYLEETNNAEEKKLVKRNRRDELILAGEIKLNSISGAKRRQLLEPLPNPEKPSDPNVVGFESDDSDSGNDSESPPPSIEPIQPEIVKTEPEIQPIQTTKPSHNPSVFVPVLRTDDIQTARLKLPILAEEQQIMETINENDVVIIAGETGSGKTTQIPQFLYEAGYALHKQIAITEPRRVAAISMSRRVAEEMNLGSNEVSYLIRFEGNATDDTKIKFMTDGVLLKELQNDFLLSKYSVVILDEAHERSIYTDILIGLLSRIVPLRNKKQGDKLKLIIMSATLRIEDFTLNKRLFKITPPVINVDSRQFPVTIHFNRTTPHNYMQEAFNKAVKIHMKLPDGGILIFLTGQQEVNCLVRKLRKKFPLKSSKKRQPSEQLKQFKGKQKIVKSPNINLDDYSIPGDLSENEEELTDNEDEMEFADDDLPIRNAQPLWVLPLYSLLSTQDQSKVFQPPPENSRLCIVSTNVAETSLTIPHIKYVIDSGKTKRKLYDKVTGVTNYMVDWTSKASAEQRAGRAGRTGPGHCYRLYSSALFNDTFDKFSQPEIQLKPVDDLYLQMKCLNIDRIVNFPFPSAPDLMQLKTAERRLEILGALEMNSKNLVQLTHLGRAIAKFPVLPRFGKMLALSHQQNLLPFTITLISALSVQEVLLEKPIGSNEPQTVRKWATLRKSWANHGNSQLLGDAMVLIRAVGAAEYANQMGKLEEFCVQNGLRLKALIEIRKLRIQMTNEIQMNHPSIELIVDPKQQPPTDLQAKLLRQILLSGMGDQIAKKLSEEDYEDTAENRKKFKYAYRANNMEQEVYLHQFSVLKKAQPDFVIYNEIYESGAKIYMRGVTAIEPEWLPIYVPKLCNLSEPLSDPEPFAKNGKVYCWVEGTFGAQGWQLPRVEIEYPSDRVDCFKWFGRFLLEGGIMRELERFQLNLLSQPGIMVKSWAKLQPRTDALLKALVMAGCCSRSKLQEVWQRNPKYLLEEYLKWVPESLHGEVRLVWPPSD